MPLPPEPHDVRAHLHGGVPLAEVDALARQWTTYPGLRARYFQARPGTKVYLDFTPAVTNRQALAELVNQDASVAKAHAHFRGLLDAWWTKHLPHIEALAPVKGKSGNVYELRRLLLASIEQALAGQRLLSDHQVRGGLARYFELFKPEFKSIAFSGWGPELIPDEDILRSQFADLLAEMEQKRTRLGELSALFSAADEEDYEDNDDTGVLPGEQVRELKATLKRLRGEAKLTKRDPSAGDANALQREADAAEARLAKHKALEDEARSLKAELRATEQRQEELVTAARTKINRDEAKRVIIARLHRVLVETYDAFLRADQRACLAALENLHDKYAETAREIEKRRNTATDKLNGFLENLGYV
jgi:type I restriction enzyme M protein